MKIRTSQYILGVIFVLHFIVVQGYGQQTKIIHYRSEKKVLLRWASTSSVMWQNSVRSGFNLERYTIIRDSLRVFPPERKVLAKDIKPLDLQNWEDLYSSNKYAAIAAQALYGETFLIDINESDLEHLKAIQLSRDQDARFSYLLLACEQSFEVAKMAGLGFEDGSVLPNEAYLYKIYKSGGYEESDTAYVFVEANESPPLPAVKDLRAKFDNNKVELKWTNDYLERNYSSYQIEYSLNGKDYFQVDNVQSIITDNQTGHASEFVRTIKLPEENRQYFVRVKGVNSFSQIGPPSNVISGFSNQKPDFEIRLSELSPLDTVVRLKLHISPEIDSVQWASTKIILKRSADSKHYKKVKETNIKTSELADLEPLQSAYYQATLVVEDLQEFKSLPILVQQVDSIPPLTPQNVHAYCDSIGFVHLSWAPNSEIDLNGYRVYRSRIKDAEYVQLTSTRIIDTTFIDSIGLISPSARIYYKVQSEDQRNNRSDLSIPILVQTKDLIPPATPRICGYEVLDSAVRIDWVPSSSNDVTKTVLFRDTEGSSDTLMITKDTSKSKFSYYDTTNYTGEGRYYVQAVDLLGNESERSNIIQVKSRNEIPGQFNVDVEVNRKEMTVRLSWHTNGHNYLVRVYESPDSQPLRLIAELQNKSSFVNEIKDINTINIYRLVFIDNGHQMIVGTKTVEIEL